jgi:hypothetical protein
VLSIGSGPDGVGDGVELVVGAGDAFTAFGEASLPSEHPARVEASSTIVRVRAKEGMGGHGTETIGVADHAAGSQCHHGHREGHRVGTRGNGCPGRCAPRFF